jgi:hypothetical protein
MNGCHPSHRAVRFSDASTYDFICDDCGATDNPLGLRGLGQWGTLASPCPNNPYTRYDMLDCKACDGTGKQGKLDCIACDGKGKVTEHQAKMQDAAVSGFYGLEGKPNQGKDRGQDQVAGT